MSKRFGKARVPGCLCEFNYTCRMCLHAAPPAFNTPAPRTFIDDGLQVAYVAGLADSTFSPGRRTGAARVAYVDGWNQTHKDQRSALEKPC